jgi:hypothetical protein
MLPALSLYSSFVASHPCAPTILFNSNASFFNTLYFLPQNVAMEYYKIKNKKTSALFTY